MPTIAQNIALIRQTLPPSVTLVCVSKYHSIEEIQEAYDAGERDFGESRVQDLLVKYEALPKDIRWHFIGHLQTNKVRAIVPFVHLIHSVDSLRLMEVIDKEAARIGRVVPILLEVHTAAEESKSGFTIEELSRIKSDGSDQSDKSSGTFPHLAIKGYMTMATNTENEQEIRRCFRVLRKIADTYPHILSEGQIDDTYPCILSMGMSDDYRIAIEEGSTLVRIGSAIFSH